MSQFVNSTSWILNHFSLPAHKIIRIVEMYLPVWLGFLYTVVVKEPFFFTTEISKNRNCPSTSVSTVNLLDVLKLLNYVKRLWRSSIICFQKTKEPFTYLDHKEGLPTALFIAMSLEHSMYVSVIAMAIRLFFFVFFWQNLSPNWKSEVFKQTSGTSMSPQSEQSVHSDIYHSSMCFLSLGRR